MAGWQRSSRPPRGSCLPVSESECFPGPCLPGQRPLSSRERSHLLVPWCPWEMRPLAARLVWHSMSLWWALARLLLTSAIPLLVACIPAHRVHHQWSCHHFPGPPRDLPELLCPAFLTVLTLTQSPSLAWKNAGVSWLVSLLPSYLPSTCSAQSNKHDLWMMWIRLHDCPH